MCCIFIYLCRMNKNKTNKVVAVPKKKKDDDQPANTEENRMINNEDILTDTGRDPNKMFEKEDTVE